NTNYTITLTGAINLGAELPAINLASGDTLTIIGGGHTLDGADTYRGLFVYAGTVAVQNLTIAHAVASGGGRGYARPVGGGGGGGGLFVGSGARVTLSDVTFSNDKAIGGRGAAGAMFEHWSGGFHGGGGDFVGGGGGGGGMGGAGGDSGFDATGGGGIGLRA